MGGGGLGWGGVGWGGVGWCGVGFGGVGWGGVGWDGVGWGGVGWGGVGWEGIFAITEKSIFFYNFDSKEIIHFESFYLPKLRVNEHKEAIFGQ